VVGNARTFGANRDFDGALRSPQLHASQPCDRLSFPEPLSRQRQPAHEATAERTADRVRYPRILEGSDHLTGAYDPGAWA